MHQHHNRELMGWREQPACSPKASWGPTCIIIYQGKALLGLQLVPPETSVLTAVPYLVLWIWVSRQFCWMLQCVV